MTFFLRLETGEQLKLGYQTGKSGDERSFTPSLERFWEELLEEEETETWSSFTIFTLGMWSWSMSATSLNRPRCSSNLALSSSAWSRLGEMSKVSSKSFRAEAIPPCSSLATRRLTSFIFFCTTCIRKTAKQS